MNISIYIKHLMNIELHKLFLVLSFSMFIASCGSSSKTTPTVQNIKLSSPSTDDSQGGFQSVSQPVFNQKDNIQSVINSISGENINSLYSVNAYKLEYITRNSANALVKVSGLLAIPDKTSASPILSFQHGTIFKNADAPTSHLGVSEDSVEIGLASLGYIVFSADYVGYGSSLGQSHPYLLKQPSADVVLDLLQAGKKLLQESNIETTSQLFMTGYSQGGYVTMAALKELQENPREGLLATGVVLGAGPYDVNTTLDVLTRGINVPNIFEGLVIDYIMDRLVPSNEITFESTILQRFFDEDRQDDVHNWRPDIAIKLFHGEDDRTVPIESAVSTFNVMKNLGADIELIRCSASPSNHRNCILPYVEYMLSYFDGLRS